MTSAFRLALFLASLAILPSCVARPGDITSGSDDTGVTPDIVGGVPAHRGDFPFIVSLTNNGSGYCAGSLLNANTVVTVAHCFTDPDVPSRDFPFYHARAGSLSWNSGGVDVAISGILIHPDYSDETIDADLALLRLSRPISPTGGIEYATLPPQDYDPVAGCNITAAGWGTTSSTKWHVPATLQELTVPVVSRPRCRTLYPQDLDPVTEGMFCAGDLGVTKNHCFGDSGGPAIDTNSGVLLGQVSWGGNRTTCTARGRPGVYVNFGRYVNWIHKNMFQ